MTREVLLRLRLDIIVKRRRRRKSTTPNTNAAPTPTDNDNDNVEEPVYEYEYDDDNEKETIIYSVEQTCSTSHPRWDHVNEHLSSAAVLDYYHHDDIIIRNGEKKNVYARFVVLSDDDTTYIAEEEEAKEEWILAEIPLHPSKLRRLPSSNNANEDTTTYNNTNDAILVERSQSSKINNTTIQIPNTLPPNTILLHYTDGYTRTTPSIYWMLVSKNVISEYIPSIDIIDNNNNNNDDSGDGKRQQRQQQQGDDRKEAEQLFDDKVFNVLGESTTITDSAVIAAATTTTDADADAAKPTETTYHDDKVFDLLGEASTNTSNAADGNNDSNSNVHKQVALRIKEEMNSMKDGVEEDHDGEDEPALVADIEAADSTGPREVEDINVSKIVIPLKEEEMDEYMAQELVVSEALPPLPPIPNESRVTTTKDEIEELRRLVKMEQQLLHDEQKRIDQTTKHLKSIMEQVHHLENNELLEIAKAIGTEKSHLFASTFRLEAHRIHLLQHLQLIFPIKLVPISTSLNLPNLPQHQYTIANLPIPDDIHNPTVTDDQVSAALGFVCHLVVLVSKYLGIPLRYTLVCKFSRSAVLFVDQYQSGNSTTKLSSRVVYPLFRERGVIDREQLDYGLLLLGRNIDCLLRTRRVDVDYRVEWNVLAKMNKLMMHVIEG